MDRPAGRPKFGSDPAYQAAMDAAARSSVLAATSGLGGFSLSNSPQPPLLQQRSITADAQAPTPLAPPPPSRPRGCSGAAPDSHDAASLSTSGAGPSTSSAVEARGVAAGPTSQTVSRSAQGPPGQEQQQQQAGRDGGGVGTGGSGVGSSKANQQPDRKTGRRSPPRSSSRGPADATARGGGGVGGGGGSRGVAREATPGRYPEHLPQEDLQRGLKGGQLFRGKIRINAANRSEAYVTVAGLPHDLLVRGDLHQNRAIEGDEVAVALQPPPAWFTVNKLAQQQQQGGANGQDASLASSAPDDCPWRSCTYPDETKALVARLLAGRPELRVTAKVVAILEPSTKREHIVGLLQLAAPPALAPSLVTPGMPPPLAVAVAALCQAGSEPPRCYLLPLDPRMPRCVVRPSEVRNLSPMLLEELLRGDAAESRTLMSARVAEWSSSHAQPAVALRASLGQAGEIESETAALLEMENIRTEDFGSEVLECLPAVPWSIGEAELSTRRDFRSTRVFSIDPPTAKDLDDALSIEPLPDGGWRVGVHIADVSHFIAPFSALDVEAGRRATSTYLVQRVIPMLPPLLCEELCSLNPGVERLTFSVVWDMEEGGTIRSTWFGRSVIRSCAKLSYPMVQQMIEGCFKPSDCAVALYGEGVTWDQIIGDSLTLWSLASRMRAARFEGGALRLDGVRLFYSLDKDGNPVTAAPYLQKEANQLVEEFMLLANMSVANCISEAFPDRAMLRRHPPPNPAKLKTLQEVASSVGMDIDVSSAATIQAGLNTLREGGPAADAGANGADGAAIRLLSSPAERHRRKVELLVMLATKPMQLAEYFCTGLIDDSLMWRHYALAVRGYTHFTSPIRRYPDVVVHRLLAAALEVRHGEATAAEAATKHRLLDTRLTGLVAEHCNDRRLAARNAQDSSLRLYLCVLLRRHPVITLATVNNVGGDRYFGAYLTEFGVEVRVEMEEAGVPLDANWNAGAKVLTLTRGSGEGRSNGGGGAGGAGDGGKIGRNRRGGGFAGRGGRGNGGGGFAGRGNGGGGFAGRGNGSDGRGRGSGGGGDSDSPSLESWVQALPEVRNPHGLQPAALPLHVQLFSDVPVILTAVTVPGQPSYLSARMYLPEAARVLEAGSAAPGAEAAASGAPAAAAAEGEPVRQSEIPWDSTLND